MSEISSNDNIVTKDSPDGIEEFLERIKDDYSQADLKTIKDSYDFAEKAHEGQTRRSGEAYIFHPLAVAAIIAELKLDVSTVCTGLLHDTVEDTEVTLEDITRLFGKDISLLVDGVTKITQMKFRNTHEKQGENIRKMIVAMGKDVRVILVKLADRLHNMRTLGALPAEKRHRIARETLDIFAPIANRLGMHTFQIELEDLGFSSLYPEISLEVDFSDKRVDMSLWDSGIQLYANPYYTTDSVLAEHGDKVTAAIRAISKGWGWAHDNVEGAVDHLVARYPNLQKESEMIAAPLVLGYSFNEKTKAGGWGVMTKENWQDHPDTYRLMGLSE